MEFMHLSELSQGMAFPEYQYTLGEDIIKKYLEAIEASDPLYGDEAYAKGQVFGHIIVPPTSIAIYVTPSRILRTLGKKPPTGMIQTGQRFEFYNPIEVGVTVTVKASVADLYEKKGRNYVVLKAESFNRKVQRAAVSYLTFIWPAQT